MNERTHELVSLTCPQHGQPLMLCIHSNHTCGVATGFHRTHTHRRRRPSSSVRVCKMLDMAMDLHRPVGHHRSDVNAGHGPPPVAVGPPHQLQPPPIGMALPSNDGAALASCIHSSSSSAKRCGAVFHQHSHSSGQRSSVGGGSSPPTFPPGRTSAGSPPSGNSSAVAPVEDAHRCRSTTTGLADSSFAVAPTAAAAVQPFDAELLRRGAASAATAPLDDDDDEDNAAAGDDLVSGAPSRTETPQPSHPFFPHPAAPPGHAPPPPPPRMSGSPVDSSAAAIGYSPRFSSAARGDGVLGGGSSIPSAISSNEPARLCAAALAKLEQQQRAVTIHPASHDDRGRGVNERRNGGSAAPAAPPPPRFGSEAVITPPLGHHFFPRRCLLGEGVINPADDNISADELRCFPCRDPTDGSGGNQPHTPSGPFQPQVASAVRLQSSDHLLASPPGAGPPVGVAALPPPATRSGSVMSQASVATPSESGSVVDRGPLATAIDVEGTRQYREAVKSVQAKQMKLSIRDVLRPRPSKEPPPPVGIHPSPTRQQPPRVGGSVPQTPLPLSIGIGGGRGGVVASPPLFMDSGSIHPPLERERRGSAHSSCSGLPPSTSLDLD